MRCQVRRTDGILGAARGRRGENRRYHAGREVREQVEEVERAAGVFVQERQQNRDDNVEREADGQGTGPARGERLARRLGFAEWLAWRHVDARPFPRQRSRPMAGYRPRNM